MVSNPRRRYDRVSRGHAIARRNMRVVELSVIVKRGSRPNSRDCRCWIKFAEAEGLELVRHAAKCGAQGAPLVVVPCYNKPTPADFTRISARLPKPQSCRSCSYNISSRTHQHAGRNDGSFGRRLPDNFRIKEAVRIGIDHTEPAVSDHRITATVGSVGMTLYATAHVGRGHCAITSVVANCLPGGDGGICAVMRFAGQWMKRDLHLQLFPLIRCALSLRRTYPCQDGDGPPATLCGAELRLPLVPISPENKKNCRSV